MLFILTILLKEYYNTVRDSIEDSIGIGNANHYYKTTS